MTGVQTCALPIWGAVVGVAYASLPGGFTAAGCPIGVLASSIMEASSEYRAANTTRSTRNGRSANDHWLFAVYVTRPGGRVQVITARDMTDRRLYRRKRREQR